MIGGSSESISYEMLRHVGGTHLTLTLYNQTFLAFAMLFEQTTIILLSSFSGCCDENNHVFCCSMDNLISLLCVLYSSWLSISSTTPR